MQAQMVQHTKADDTLTLCSTATRRHLPNDTIGPSDLDRATAITHPMCFYPRLLISH